jgi:hypothetical protein
MNNKIEVFKNEQFGEIRTALIENEPWFVAVSHFTAGCGREDDYPHFK